MPTRIFSPDSPDEMAFGQLRAPISVVRSNPYAGLSSRILTDPTGERRNRQFRQRFRGLRSCRPNPSGESGLISLGAPDRHSQALALDDLDIGEIERGDFGPAEGAA